MSSSTSYHNRVTTSHEQCVYDHLLACAAVESPEELIARFQSLFINSVGYPNQEVVAALDNVLSAPDVEQYFRYILNRCCHILINRWQCHPQLQQSIPELVRLFESGPTRRMTEFSRGRSARRLRYISQKFCSTEQFLALRRLARVIEAKRYSATEEVTSKDTSASTPLGSLINRYPYLYEHCLLTEDSGFEQHQHVRRIQKEAQRRFEVDLSQYVTYRVRQSQGAREPISAHQPKRPIKNPTLLQDCELIKSLNQFSRTCAGQSYNDLAQRFILRSQSSPTYRDFKKDLYDYICSGIEPSYGKRQFNRLLAKHLETTFPDSDDRPMSDFLVVRTCSQLLNFLVVDVSAGKQHYVFVDLINNLGPVLTTGLLLQVLLICRKVKSHLERRFSVLFNHYESAAKETVEWLIQMLEHLNIALSLNFGSLDLSHARAR